jgi:hypothetical protein
MRTTVAVDASFLGALLDQRARRAVPQGPDAIVDLIDNLSVQKAKVIVPTPALAEVLTHAPTVAQAYLGLVKRCACFQIRPFDDKASMELVRLLGTSHPAMKELLNFDRQIVAIARAYGATVLYADDEKVVQFATECGLPAVRFKELQRSPKHDNLHP